MPAMTPAIFFVSTRLKSNRWQRDSMVAASLCTSVVASMNIASDGGSSSVFKRALKAFADNA